MQLNLPERTLGLFHVNAHQRRKGSQKSGRSGNSIFGCPSIFSLSDPITQ